MSNDFLNQVKGKMIVSCQALPEEPLHSSFIMARMAKAAKLAGAPAIRANSIVDIEAIQAETGLPVLGINKHVYPDAETFITPTIEDMTAIAETGCAAVAVEVTGRTRPHGQSLADNVKQFRAAYPNTLLMADTASLADVSQADELGFDMIGTTLYGYTEATAGRDLATNDFEYLKQVLKAAKHPVIAEGKIDTPEKLRRCIDLGVHAAVVGSAITRPLTIAQRFMQALA
ncbi:N-acetylmannosamine-6-phosphate 2-epimerase [Lacticaseibacillus kribbianus]|uniref:N-acetylmannosamine-6-phosphate 2-epimerase n=1 Tax=Lacticaseibacillus kribbianus TaxID=2926292 RepID=UPI001CD72AF0|nr:N-acetylmannosamine-6-phosphate 2-epimerase [Lacticaseibacillus kribbianus]